MPVTLKKDNTFYCIVFVLIMEHATGIEPAYSAWEANVLPMNYACK